MQRGEPVEELDILILGPLPPPFGGISVHLTRVVPLLSSAGFRVGVLNHFGSTDLPYAVGALKRNPLNYYRLPKRHRARIVHYHHSRWSQLVAVALGKGDSSARYIITLHAGDIEKHFPQLTSTFPLVPRITRWALSRFDAIIVVDPKIASVIRDHVGEQRIELLPAFLEGVAGAPERYEVAVEKFLDSGRVLVAAAYSVNFLRDGGEIYGLDTLTEAFTSLATKRPDLRLALFVAMRPSRRKARRHLAALERRLEQAGVRERVLIAFGLPLLPALRKNAIFVRPTRAEGDAVSVREAQRARVRVVASDVIGRPVGVATFSTGDVADLCVALHAALEDSDPRAGPALEDPPDASAADRFADRLISLYRDELGLYAGELPLAPASRDRTGGG